MQNYFELFDLETSFFISDSNLKDSYRREIARFHPDKFASKTDSEKLQALQNTSLLNTAFEMIKSPLNRASYLLKLDGVDPFDEKDTAMDHDFLISQIELREELEVIESKTDTGKLDDFIDRIESHVQSKVESISNAFKDTSDTLEIKKDVR
ncbi:MAG: Fe-S protein assembly co-chaperone HscB, partial [Thiotrichales bacterium]|nr:Fe-S protein assembly co-chaperone HscB [Thiotrichales bacterium]